jgi:hypothetical protein
MNQGRLQDLPIHLTTKSSSPIEELVPAGGNFLFQFIAVKEFHKLFILTFFDIKDFH